MIIYHTIQHLFYIKNGRMRRNLDIKINYSDLIFKNSSYLSSVKFKILKRRDKELSIVSHTSIRSRPGRQTSP